MIGVRLEGACARMKRTLGKGQCIFGRAQDGRDLNHPATDPSWSSGSIASEQTPAETSGSEGVWRNSSWQSSP